jgi:hypothetical protein
MSGPMDRRAAYVAGLRALADLIETHPILPLPMESIGHSFYLRGDEARPALAVLEAAGLDHREVKIDPEKANYGFELSGRLHGVKLRAIADAADVCKPTGTTVVTTYAYQPTQTPAQAAAPDSSPEADVPPASAPGEPSAEAVS